jgi:acyl-CoA thioesterase-1
VFDNVTANPDIPDVLIIGDSISIGYTAKVREYLKTKANVYRAPTNCGPTDSGVANITNWLDGKMWDVIHFNFGLHDMMYIDGKGQLDDSGRQVNSILKYKLNLEHITIQLKASAEKVIFATTTPVTEGTRGFVIGDPAKYNAVAIEIMKKHKVIINDLNDINTDSLRKYQAPKDVHFYQEGYKFLAQKVALVLENVLEKNN